MARRVAEGQRSLGDALLHPGLGQNRRLDRIGALLDWAAIERLLSGIRRGEVGAPPYPALLMFKALLLQQWYGLSDPELEEALTDRLSFRRFIGLGTEQAGPDHSTLWRFRQTLEQAVLARQLFGEITRQLDTKGLVLRQGTLIDASLIAAQSAPPPPPAEGTIEPGSSKLVGSAREPEADWTRRGKQHHFGYKAHLAVDQTSQLVREAILTGASCNDTTVADALIQGDEAAVYADKAYGTQARHAALRQRGIRDRIMQRANKHHPELGPWAQRRNRLIGHIRGRVETLFATLKCHYGFRRARYLTLARNQVALLLACTAINLRRALMLTA
jgi:IS5 family transposase